MRLRTSFLFNLVLVGFMAALLTIPGEAKPVPAAAGTVSAQAAFGLFLDPHAEPLLTIELATGVGSF